MMPTENLPTPRKLFFTPGEAHAALLVLIDEVLAELEAEGIKVDEKDYLLRYGEAWEVWKRYAPSYA